MLRAALTSFDLSLKLVPTEKYDTNCLWNCTHLTSLIGQKGLLFQRLTAKVPLTPLGKKCVLLPLGVG
jgi:hypothetical protein